MNKTLLDPTWTDPRMLEPQSGIGKIKVQIYHSEPSFNELLNETYRMSGFNHALMLAANLVSNPKEAIAILSLVDTKSISLPSLDVTEKELAFSWSETVNGIEAFCENPKITRASDQDYDIKEAIEKELGFRIDHLNYIA